jgi:hypothetical protein
MNDVYSSVIGGMIGGSLFLVMASLFTRLKKYWVKRKEQQRWTLQRERIVQKRQDFQDNRQKKDKVPS